MKRFLVLVAVLAMFTTVAVAQDSPPITLTMTATVTGGATLSVVNPAFTYTLPYPVTGNWIGSVPRAVTMTYSFATGHHARLLLATSDFTPAVTGDTTATGLCWTMTDVVGGTSVPPSDAFPLPGGAQKVLFISTNGSGVSTANLVLSWKNTASFKPGTYTVTVTMLVMDSAT